MEYDPVLLRIASAWRDLRRMKPSDLSIDLPVGQIDTLDVIARIGPCTMNALSDALRIDASTATRAVEPLVNSGLVARHRGEQDGRQMIVELTRAGRRVERQLTEERLARVDRSLADFDPAERETLADMLERMVAGSRAVDDRHRADGQVAAAGE